MTIINVLFNDLNSDVNFVNNNMFSSFAVNLDNFYKTHLKFYHKTEATGECRGSYSSIQSS